MKKNEEQRIEVEAIIKDRHYLGSEERTFDQLRHSAGMSEEEFAAFRKGDYELTAAQTSNLESRLNNIRTFKMPDGRYKTNFDVCIWEEI